jgi:hypothetical protein
MWESPEGLAPGGPNVTVRMADEQVDIKVVEDGRQPLALVSATFDMANDGPTATMLTGFPNFAYSAVDGDYDPVTFTPDRITNFKAWTDTTTFTPGLRQIKDVRGPSSWFVWTVTYPQGKTVAVHVAYQQQLEHAYAGWIPVSYVLRTGALWNGSINNATITMSSGAGAVLSSDLAPQQRDGSKLVWSLDNFKPTRDINGVYINSESWAKLQAAQSTASAPEANAADLVSSANAVLDVVVHSDRSEWAGLGTLYRTPMHARRI